MSGFFYIFLLADFKGHFNSYYHIKTSYFIFLLFFVEEHNLTHESEQFVSKSKIKDPILTCIYRLPQYCS